MQEYFKSKLITYINEDMDKDMVLKILAEMITPEPSFYEDIISREALGGTGIGGGIALPHARIEGLEKPKVAIALLQNKIDFSSPDNEKTKLVIMVAAPKGRNREYLSFISKLTRLFRDAKNRDNIMCSKNYDELLEAIAGVK